MSSPEPVLSILIPAIYERVERASALYRELDRQIMETRLNVEVLLLLDNMRRSVGLKRQALLEAARGRFVAFVDDDDWVHPEYVQRVASAARDAPGRHAVLTFDQWAVISQEPNNGARRGLVRVAFDNPNEELRLEGPDPGCRRKPMHTCAWARATAMLSKFSDKNYGEDADWARPLWLLKVPDFRVCDVPLYEYRWSATGTRALPEDKK